MPDLAFATLDPDAAEHRFQRLRQALGVSTFGINLLVFEPGQRSRIHRHETQEEVYLVLAGELTLLVEREPHVLRRGDLVRVGNDMRRQLVNRRSERLQVLALGGSCEHKGRDGRAYASWDEQGEGRSPAEVPFPEDER